MWIHVVKSKIHNVHVTESNLNYIGSITIDEDLIDAAGIYEHEKVQIVNNNNGERFETYVIPGERGSGVICLNGAAARKVAVGDVVIIIAYGIIDEKEASEHKPKVIFPDTFTNKLVR
ncbi:MAG: aspartate 1-decarboxylase [Bacteroidales bacterium]|nr:aspartate 1-decarboxylase [Bacteroidales bacterium]